MIFKWFKYSFEFSDKRYYILFGRIAAYLLVDIAFEFRKKGVKSLLGSVVNNEYTFLVSLFGR